MNLLLVFHIIFASISLLLNFAGLGTVILEKGNYRKLINQIAGFTLITSISGGALFLSQAYEISLVQFCSRLGLYLLVTCGVQGMLFLKLRHLPKSSLIDSQ
jgi:hypothetical protein